jgi:hypothetical protein
VSEDRHICVNEYVKGQSSRVFSSFIIFLFLITPILIYAIPNLASADASSNNTMATNASSNNTMAPPETINQTRAAQNTTIINSIFDSSLPIVFIIVIFLALIIPLIFDMYLAYKRRPESRDSPRVTGMPGLYRSLMAFGIIILLGTVIFYLLALITLNLNEESAVISSLVDLLANLGTILGTALATIIAFYFGIRGTETAVEKAAAAVTG